MDNQACRRRVTLNQFKPVLRKAFPIKRSRIPRAGIEGAVPEIVPDYSVINGLAIARYSRHFPGGVRTSRPRLCRRRRSTP